MCHPMLFNLVCIVIEIQQPTMLKGMKTQYEKKPKQIKKSKYRSIDACGAHCVLYAIRICFYVERFGKYYDFFGTFFIHLN